MTAVVNHPNASHTNDEASTAALPGWPIVHLQDITSWTPDFKRLPFAEAARRRCALFSGISQIHDKPSPSPQPSPKGRGSKGDTSPPSTVESGQRKLPLPLGEGWGEGIAREDGPPNTQHHFITTDPFDADQLAWARTRFGAVQTHLVSPSTFDAWLNQAEQSMTALEGLGSMGHGAGAGAASTQDALSNTNSTEHLRLRGIDASQSPAVRFVNSTLYDALKTGASDIHLESNPSGLVVKFRIDGVLTPMRRLEGGAGDVALAEQTISRIKVMAQLDIAERRVPQDGRLQIQYGDTGQSAHPSANQSRTIDVRVSIMPSIHGEDAVLRILDRQHLAQTLAGLTLEKLGYDATAQQALKALCRKPHGMLLVTGPTGSGKTTTLYAAITETHESRDKVITIEDPVEYQLPGVLQIPVNERKGLTFAKGLRSILRHDPDKILVGEIRDAETAQIAVQSALTGHLVFTTVHANTVFDVVGRFEQFGIDAYTLASAINGVLAQRLLRKLCTLVDVNYPDRSATTMLAGGSGEGI